MSCVVVAFSLHCSEFMEAYFRRAKVSTRISIEQYRSRIGSHDNFVKTKDNFGSFLEFDAYDVLFKCILLASIETSWWITQNVELCDVLVFTNDFLQSLFIPLLIRT